MARSASVKPVQVKRHQLPLLLLLSTRVEPTTPARVSLPLQNGLLYQVTCMMAFLSIFFYRGNNCAMAAASWSAIPGHNDSLVVTLPSPDASLSNKH